MRKLSKNQKADIESVKYRWEFLRRNQKYMEEWMQLQRNLEEKTDPPPLPKSLSHIELISDNHCWNTVMIINGIRVCMACPQRTIMTPKEREFCEKWNISEPVDPSQSYDEYFSHELKELKKALADGKCDDINKVRKEIEKVDTCILYWKLRPLQNIPIKELDGFRDFV